MLSVIAVVSVDARGVFGSMLSMVKTLGVVSEAGMLAVAVRFGFGGMS